MTSNDSNSNCNQKLGLCGFDEPSAPHLADGKKPLEIYTFIDPLCPECWEMEPILKKLQMSYYRYFTIRYIVGGKLQCCSESKSSTELAHILEKTTSRTGIFCDGQIWMERPLSTPFAASIAIKAAELQGKQVGVRFLRKLRELFFLDKQGISEEKVIIECAKSVHGLDVNEFIGDLQSDGAIKALQCDLKTTKEMGVTSFPTIVVFNDKIDEEGVMITGLYEYDVYVKVLEEMLGETLVAAPPPFLEDVLKHFSFVSSKELAVIYEITVDEVGKEMKKLVLQQLVERITIKHETYWRYLKE